MQTGWAPPRPGRAEPAAPGGAGALAGAVASGAALAAGELVAGLAPSLPSLVEGVADLVIDTVPAPVKDLAIAVFGTADKVALGVGIVLVTLLLGAIVGRTGRRPLVTAVFSGFGVAAALAAARPPDVGIIPALLAAGLAVGAGLATHAALAARAPGPADAGRRSFLVAGAVVAGLALVAAGAGRALLVRSRRALAGREEVALPPAADPLPPTPPDASFGVAGISPLITPNDDFFRIDTVAFAVPRVDLAAWRLRIHGRVDRDLELGYEELLDMDLVERHVTLSCVSNQVGGGLVGTAAWLGVPLAPLLERAGVRPDAEQVVGRSVDDFTVGFPVAAALDGREAMVAVGMNGEPLPLEHGFPARLVVAGLYGYVSATKWLAEIELTGWDDFDAYWVPRGWAKEAPVKTQSRIDVPRGEVAAGPQVIAGVAWAPDRGISKVEVSVDGGEWREAELAVALSDDAWRQWRLEWEATPGTHSLRVRATDGTGEVQTAEVAPPAPDGATGHHTRSILVV